MDTSTPTQLALQRAIDKAGGKTALRRGLNSGGGHAIKSHNVVTQWAENRVPAEYCPTIELLFGVRCEELRPDINWAVLRATTA